MPRLCLPLAFVLIALAYFEASAGEPPVYERSRNIEFVNAGFGGTGMGGAGFYGGYPSFGLPYAYPFYGAQSYVGTWYQRPYPYHFDYFKMRYSVPPIQQIAPDCPCAETMVQ